MRIFNRSMILRISVLFGISVIAIGFIYTYMRPYRLKVYKPKDVNPDLVDASINKREKNHKIKNFNLINQNGKEFTRHDFDGKIYVADFFFTTCTNICIPMTQQMKRIQDEFINDDEVMLLSHTVQPEVDSVSVLKAYADKNGVVSKKWYLATGNKKDIYDLARKSYFAVMTKGDGGQDDFIHTQNFILVDKEKRIRGYYDGTKRSDITKLIRDIYVLKMEYK